MQRIRQFVLSAFLIALTTLNGWAVSAAGIADAQCQTQMHAACCADDNKQCRSAQSAIVKATDTCSCQLSCGPSCTHCLQILSAIDSTYFLSEDGSPVVGTSASAHYAFHSVYLLFRPPRLSV